MDFDDYQRLASRTDLLGDGSARNARDPSYVAKILGIVGEAGELADKYKKIIRDKEGNISKEDKESLIKELGDVLWYTAMLARYLDIEFSYVAKQNIAKLVDRKNRDVLKGQGDDR